MPISNQEEFWKGEFGNEYTGRNRGGHWIASNAAFFGRALVQARRIQSVLELGSNLGLNLAALTTLLPEASLSAVEINERAAAELRESLPTVDLHVTSILEFQPTTRWDLVFTKGVLIHLDPKQLPSVYRLMHRATSRYLLVAEYYSPKPREIDYRGHAGKLFMRDFAGEMLELFPDLKLVDYGFVYHRDTNFPQDDLTWFLMEKD
jgi:pseudaminic acid biosynthesis-associated methylase